MGYYDGAYEREVYKERRMKDADVFEAMLCEIFLILTDEQFKKLSYASRSWWKEKQEAIALQERLQRERDARELAIQTGLAKLTLEERKALGLGPDAKIGRR